MGPVGIEILYTGRSWFTNDLFGILLFGIFLTHIAYVIVKSAKHCSLVRLVAYTAVMYVYAGRNSLLLLAGAATIIAPEALAYKLRSNLKLAV